MRHNFPQRTLYDYRGIDGTGTKASPATGSNQVSYVVRKLADGNCWMSENLKLTLSTSHSYEVATFSGGTTSWTPNSGSTNAYNVALNGNTVCTSSGCWYNWYAATAGQGAQTSNPTISQSICPKGWRLPTLSGTYSWQKLIGDTYEITSDEAGIRKLTSLPLSFEASGILDKGNVLNSPGIYAWTSTAGSTASAANALYASTSANILLVGSEETKYRAAPMRCVLIP